MIADIEGVIKPIKVGLKKHFIETSSLNFK